MLDGEDFRPGGQFRRHRHRQPGCVGQGLSQPEPDRPAHLVSWAGRCESPAWWQPPSPAPSVKILIHASTSRWRGTRGATTRSTGMTLVLRTRGNPAGYAPLMRLAIRNIDPALAVFDVRTMDTQLAQALFLPRATALLFGLAGLMGLLISTVGIYGVVSFSVARQTREIGVRMAMGARRGQVLGMVLKQGLILTVTGSAIGLGLALALGPHGFESSVWRESHRYPDPHSGPGTPAVRRARGLPGACAPRRVARPDPRLALRVKAQAAVQEPRCGATRSINSRDEMIFVFFQNFGKCRWLPVTR